MRHRIVSGTGLGNPDSIILNNKGKIRHDFANDVINNYFKVQEGFDFRVENESVTVGIEPTYQYDELKIIHINKDKNKSYIQHGKAWGPYGSQIAKNTKLYGDYEKKSKFVKFVDKWHLVLFNEQNTKTR